MIKYALRCDRSHAFESWFRDGSAYEALAAAGELACPDCGSAAVSKAVMAPSIAKGRVGRAVARREAQQQPQPPAPPQTMAMMGPEERNLREMVRALHRKIADTSENVGGAFPEEARRIHEGEAPQRAIHGQATGEEVKALIEDGVPLLPIPPLPDERN